MRLFTYFFILLFFSNILIADDIVSKLKSLKEMYKEKSITKEEFEKAKSILLQSSKDNIIDSRDNILDNNESKKKINNNQLIEKDFSLNKNSNSETIKTNQIPENKELLNNIIKKINSETYIAVDATLYIKNNAIKKYKNSFKYGQRHMGFYLKDQEIACFGEHNLRFNDYAPINLMPVKNLICHSKEFKLIEASFKISNTFGGTLTLYFKDEKGKEVFSLKTGYVSG